jgi:hypothetical protein
MLAFVSSGNDGPRLAEVLAGELSQGTLHECDYLASFDALGPRILPAAKSAYTSHPDNAITLSLDHFT